MNAYKLTDAYNILTHEELNNMIKTMLYNASITRERNDFFTTARKSFSISLETAYKIAYHWRSFTRQFIFTSLTGIGTLSEKANSLETTPDEYLSVLQTSVNIVTDDLYNASHLFSEAPKGTNGIHYRWWEETILHPLENMLVAKGIPTITQPGPNTKRLLEVMARQSHSHLGIAVQLRIVEVIALEISIAFRNIFSRLKNNNEAVFTRHDLMWIFTHIKAEIVHDQQVNDHENGVLQIANTIEEQNQLLKMMVEYITAYKNYLDELKDILLQDASITQSTRGGRKWRCLVCDFIYDEAAGLPEDNIAPGTSWDEIPENWSCPDCGVKKTDFQMVEILE